MNFTFTCDWFFKQISTQRIIHRPYFRVWSHCFCIAIVQKDEIPSYLLLLCLHLCGKDGGRGWCFIICRLHGKLYRTFFSLYDGMCDFIRISCLHNDDCLLSSLCLKCSECLALQNLSHKSIAQCCISQAIYFITVMYRTLHKAY